MTELAQWGPTQLALRAAIATVILMIILSLYALYTDSYGPRDKENG